MENIIENNLKEAVSLFQKIEKEGLIQKQVYEAASLSVSACKAGHKVLFAGNGGSAADAQHMAAELVSRFYLERGAIASIALTTDSSIITAIGNDYTFDTIFSRQIEAIGSKGDVLVAISTSGNSKNILNGLITAKKKGLHTILFTGKDGGTAKKRQLAEIMIVVPSENTPRIQEIHEFMLHSYCQLVESALSLKE